MFNSKVLRANVYIIMEFYFFCGSTMKFGRLFDFAEKFMKLLATSFVYIPSKPSCLTRREINKWENKTKKWKIEIRVCDGKFKQICIKFCFSRKKTLSGWKGTTKGTEGVIQLGTQKINGKDAEREKISVQQFNFINHQHYCAHNVT